MSVSCIGYKDTKKHPNRQILRKVFADFETIFDDSESPQAHRSCPRVIFV